MKPVLAIGNLNYSSWSLRAWLSMRFAKIDFDELLIDLDQPGYGEARIAQVLAVSPSGRVPALKVGEEQIWDTIGIAMWALEQASSRGQQANLLPASQASRNLMWSVIGEMHSGFAALRRELTMNLIRRCQAYGLSKEALADIERVDQLWRQCREGHANAGPYLFGTRSLADAFFVPVATRFRTYKIALSASAQSYADCLLSDPDFRVWEDRVLAGPAPSFSRANHDHVYADPAPADSATPALRTPITRAALIPIDMQQAFALPPYGQADIEIDGKGLALLAAWRARGWPILHVQHDSLEPNSELRPERPGNALRPGFTPVGDEPLLRKSVNSAFIGTDLDLRLRRLGIDTVVLFGFTADRCVSTTARMASNLGYRTIVVADACASFAELDQHGATVSADAIARAHLATLAAEFAQTPNTEQLIAGLANGSSG